MFKDDATVQRLCRERYGIEDMAEVACDPWYYGERFGKSGHTLPSERSNAHRMTLVRKKLPL